MRPSSRLLQVLVAASVFAAGELVAETFALLPVRRGVRQPEVAGSVERALERELMNRGKVVAAERTRSSLRQLRLRNPDGARPEQLVALASDLGADWLISAAVHDAPEGNVPDLTLSARLYDGRSGRVAWAGTVARSGLDSRKLLGIGAILNLASLVPLAVSDLLAPLGASGTLLPPLEQAVIAGAEPGPLALVPFTVVEVEDGVEVASAATETLRALLSSRGVELAEPGCVAGALRAGAGVQWGELGAESRGRLRTDCGAELLVTGSVERWEIGGSGRAPEPVVAVAVRLLEAATGEILWTGSLEERGWKREGWFGRGRVFSRGEHLRRLLETIGSRMLAADPAVKVMKESS